MSKANLTASSMAVQPRLPVLQIRALRVVFGGILALDGVSFDIQEGEILGLIGPNGAGKTTLFNCLSGLYKPLSGDITLVGQSILNLPAHRRAELGLGRTFQNVALFDRLSVRDNILAGAHAGTTGDFVSDALRLPWAKRTEASLREKADRLIAELALESVADESVAGLPFGTRKRVELARGLASDPKLLMLDEPASGLNHEEVNALGQLIRQLRDTRRLTVLIVEHHMGLVMSISDRVVVLNFGRKIAEGSTSAIQNDPEVIRSYLGGAAA